MDRDRLNPDGSAAPTTGATTPGAGSAATATADASPGATTGDVAAPTATDRSAALAPRVATNAPTTTDAATGAPSAASPVPPTTGAALAPRSDAPASTSAPWGAPPTTTVPASTAPTTTAPATTAPTTSVPPSTTPIATTPSDATPSDAPPSSRPSLLSRASKYLPWTSLLGGVVGAIMMDRRPGRAWIVVVAAAAAWALLVGFALVSRLDPARFTGRRQLLVKGLHVGALLAVQSVVQLALLFPLPFYLRAAALSTWHVAFLVALAGAAAVALWDPWWEAVVKRPLPSFLLVAFAAFVGTNAALPVLGLSNRAALVVAGLGTAIGAPLFAVLTAPPEQRRRRAVVVGVAAALLVPGALLTGAARLVPPAPLELVRAGIGTQVLDMELVDPVDALDAVPAQLVCFTAIKAPLGLKDGLFHVWSKDGVVVDRVALDVRGGRAEGFRTWSAKKNQLGPGDWRCAVETASGQLLGGVNLRLRTGRSTP